MALINHRAREIHFKIVYYGPGLGGKTTNLRSLHDRLPPERRGKLISIATDHERTLFFDFLPIDLGQVNGFTTRFHLYTVPGQVYYRLSRRAVLQGLDGLVFVADSHPSREQANVESLADLHDHLRTIGLTGPALARIPWVIQYNKRDVPLAVPLARLRAAINEHDWPEFEAVASEGRGVTETLRSICKAVLARLAPGAAPAHAAEAPAAAAVAPPVPAAAAPAPAPPAPPPAPPRVQPPPARRPAPAFSAAPLRTSRFPLPPPRPAASTPRAGTPERPAAPAAPPAGRPRNT